MFQRKADGILYLADRLAANLALEPPSFEFWDRRLDSSQKVEPFSWAVNSSRVMRCHVLETGRLYTGLRNAVLNQAVTRPVEDAIQAFEIGRLRTR